MENYLPLDQMHCFTQIPMRTLEAHSLSAVRKCLFNSLIFADTLYMFRLFSNLGRAIAQAISHWLLRAAARVRAQFWSCGICSGQSGAVSLSVLFPPGVPQSQSSIIWGWYNRPVVAAVPSGLSLTTLRIIKLQPQFENSPWPWLHENPDRNIHGSPKSFKANSGTLYCKGLQLERL
jgi:hypothetical protein